MYLRNSPCATDLKSNLIGVGAKYRWKFFLSLTEAECKLVASSVGRKVDLYCLFTDRPSPTRISVSAAKGSLPDSDRWKLMFKERSGLTQREEPELDEPGVIVSSRNSVIGAEAPELGVKLV